MIDIACAAVLLDIEGTVSPVAFVHEVMFPYARAHVAEFLRNNAETAETKKAIELMAIDAGFSDADQWCRQTTGADDGAGEFLTGVVHQVETWMDRDAKLTGLKALQGQVWRRGFESGELVSALFPDALHSLRRWRQDGLPLFIYSSGSVTAQHLFFQHTRDGDLRELFSGYFDTTSGGKKEAASYHSIAGQIGLPPASICFISDVVEELDAAREAGMQTVLRFESSRPESGHCEISRFDQLTLAPGKPGQLRF